MTTLTVVKKNGLAAIAADSLTKWGYVKESADYVVNHNKILAVQDSYIAICGPSSAKIALGRYFSENEARLDSVDHIFETWRAIHEAMKEKYFLNPQENSNDSYESTRMDVLIANSQGIFGVSAYRHVQEFSKFYSYGNGNEYASGAMYAIYDDPKKSAEEVARFGVQAATEFDDSSGLPIISYTVRQAAK